MRVWRVIRLGGPKDAMQLAAGGVVRPPVSERLSLEELVAGVQRPADGVTVGRVVHVRENH